MASSAFGSKKRPAGKVYRSYGPLARLVTDIYNDVESGFVATETSITGSASTGVDGPNVQYTAAQTAGAALSACTVPVMLELSIANAASANNDFTGLVGKHKVIDFWVVTEAAGDVANTFQLQTGAGVAISDAVAPGAASGATKHAASIAAGATKILASGATIRVAHVRTANSSLAKCYVLLAPVA